MQERANQSLFNLEALTHHLKCNLVRGGVQAAADLVTGDKIDGLDLLKNAATNTIVDALGEHLAREIKSDYLREKFGAVEHKVLHGALGAFSGALLNPEDPLHGAASGAIGAFVAETAAEALAGQQTSYTLNEYIDECGRNGTEPTQNGFYDRMVDVVVNHPHREGLFLRGNIAKVVGAAGALFAGYDPDIAFRTANNAIENGFLLKDFYRLKSTPAELAHHNIEVQSFINLSVLRGELTYEEAALIVNHPAMQKILEKSQKEHWGRGSIAIRLANGQVSNPESRLEKGLMLCAQAAKALTELSEAHPTLTTFALRTAQFALSGPVGFVRECVMEGTGLRQEVDGWVDGAEGWVKHRLQTQGKMSLRQANVLTAAGSFGILFGLGMAGGIDKDKILGKAKDVVDKIKVHMTYLKAHPKGGKPYVGRTSGKVKDAKDDKALREIVRKRDRNHHMNKEGFERARIDKVSLNPQAIRGHEHRSIEKLGGPQSKGGTSSNKISGIAAKNPKKSHYLEAAKKEFGHE